MRYHKLGEGYESVDAMRSEIKDYMDVLLGRTPPPIDRGEITLMELAEAYHARASEMEMILLDLEADGVITKGSRPYKFRTGYLRTFIEVTRKTMELGSRRVTHAVAQADGKVQ